MQNAINQQVKEKNQSSRRSSICREKLVTHTRRGKGNMYSRETELRLLRPNDVYKLAVILDDNQCWRKLMEVIPKELNDTYMSGEPKYNNDHIRLIESAIQRPGESRLYSQILFDEWGTSGKKHERPTLGVLMQLLVRAELFRAADFVAMNFLNEPPPERPFNGPAARIDISLSDEMFADIEDVVNDSSFYPGTASLNDNANYANSLADNNKDFYTKYHQHMEKHVETTPKPPPRTLRASRQLQQQSFVADTTAETVAGVSSIAVKIEHHDFQPNSQPKNTTVTETIQSDNIPKFSTLMSENSKTVHMAIDTSLTFDQNNSSSSSTNQRTQPITESSYISDAPIPMISILAQTTTTKFANQRINESGATNPTTSYINLPNSLTDNEILPIISALNIAGTPDEAASLMTSEQHLTSGSGIISGPNSRSSSLSNDSLDDEGITSNRRIDKDNCQVVDGQYVDYDNDDEDEENGVPNLSIFEQRSSNNDSSLTTVTDDNSFDLNDCSSTSNENIPCLSALKQ